MRRPGRRGVAWLTTGVVLAIAAAAAITWFTAGGHNPGAASNRLRVQGGVSPSAGEIPFTGHYTETIALTGVSGSQATPGTAASRQTVAATLVLSCSKSCRTGSYSGFDGSYPLQVHGRVLAGSVHTTCETSTLLLTASTAPAPPDQLPASLTGILTRHSNCAGVSYSSPASIRLVRVPEPTAPQAAVSNLGAVGPSYAAGVHQLAGDKPESRVWRNDGLWWADLFDSGTKSWRIFRLDDATQTWMDTGTTVDSRVKSAADTLWDGKHLYVASHVPLESSNAHPFASQADRPAELFRFSYNATAKTYTLDPGFPVTITDNSSESLVFDEASDGSLWATWTQVSKDSSGHFINAVYYNTTAGADTNWGVPSVLPVANPHPSPDDISDIITFQNYVGIVWSDQLRGEFDWAVHKVGSGRDSWTASVAEKGVEIADDHLDARSLSTDPQGRVYIVAKTSLNDKSRHPTLPLIQLLVYYPNTKVWTIHTVATIGDCATRPTLVLDDYQQIHVYLTEPDGSCTYSGAGGSIFEKTAAMDNPVFADVRGVPVMRDVASSDLSDASSLKQSQGTDSAITNQSGIVVLADNDQVKTYWHSYESIAKPSH